MHELLIIEDDNASRIILKRNLGDRDNFIIHTASQVDEARTILAEHKGIKVIMCDYLLGGEDGLAFFKSLQTRKHSSVRILFSAYPDNSIMLDAIDDGVIDYFLEKPIDTNLLLMMVKKAIHTYEITSQNKLLKLVANHEQKVTKSINYARRIQNSMLPGEKELTDLFPSSFVFYKQRDIIGGDFFFVEKVEDTWDFRISQPKKVVVVGDCTGHGVPGALMTILSVTIIDEIINKFQILNPNEILSELNRKLYQALHKSMDVSVSDGLDLCVLIIDEDEMEVTMSAAHQELLLVRNGEGQRIKGGRFSIGQDYEIHPSAVDVNKITLEKGDRLFLYSDGFADQFGGENNRKLLSRNFRELIIKNHQTPMKDMKLLLNDFHANWKGKNHQTDDITVLGIEI